MNATHPSSPLVQVRAWDRVVRSTHWVVALAIVVLSVTGVYIGHPFLISPGPDAARFTMGTVKVIHFYAAIAFTIAVLSRILWMFVGKGHATWKEFIPVETERRRGLVHALLFYLFVRRRPDPAIGHNPAAGAAYTAVFLLYLAVILTGLGLYGADAAFDSPLHVFQALLGPFGGAQIARWIHHAIMWLLLMFVVHHLYSAVLTSAVESNGVMDSIFSGKKWVPEHEARADAQARP